MKENFKMEGKMDLEECNMRMGIIILGSGWKIDETGSGDSFTSKQETSTKANLWVIADKAKATSSAKNRTAFSKDFSEETPNQGMGR